MSACAKCGYDPAAKVGAAYVFRIDRDPPSLNERLHNAGDRRWAYAKQRNEWLQWFMVARANHGITLASGRRRVTLTRLYGGRQQERDRDNLVGGMKVIVDAMVHALLLHDDSPQWAEIHYAQERGAARGLRVQIEDLT